MQLPNTNCDDCVGEFQKFSHVLRFLSDLKIELRFGIVVMTCDWVVFMLRFLMAQVSFVTFEW